MKFEPPLIRAVLIKRYKRFLADIRLPDGTQVTAHCPNPGAMTGLAQAGSPIWVQSTAHKGGKLNWSWKLVELEGDHFAGIDTNIPNRITRTALDAGDIAGLPPYTDVRPEQRYGTNSRVDFLLKGGPQDIYLEVKNVHLCRTTGLAEFPDSVTARGTKHLHDLADVAQAGAKAVMLYVIQRTDCTAATLAPDIDPKYCAAFKAATAAGVETLAIGTAITRHGITLGGAIPFTPPA